jgi:hypothetical protein
MSMIHQKTDAVIFSRDGIGFGFSNQMNFPHEQLISAGSPDIGAYDALHPYRRFLRDLAAQLKCLGTTL